MQLIQAIKPFVPKRVRQLNAAEWAELDGQDRTAAVLYGYPVLAEFVIVDYRYIRIGKSARHAFA